MDRVQNMNRSQTPLNPSYLKPFSIPTERPQILCTESGTEWVKPPIFARSL
jgi:hypothetical protein